MKLEELMAAASQETSCLRYYGSAQKNPNSEETTRLDEPFNDACFYDRLIGIGYTKVVMTLSKRCVPHFVTSKNPVLNSSIEELEVISGQHDFPFETVHFTNRKKKFGNDFHYIIINKENTYALIADSRQIFRPENLIIKQVNRNGLNADEQFYSLPKDKVRFFKLAKKDETVKQ
jgi:hypothetical protein